MNERLGLKDDARENALARAWERFRGGDAAAQARSAGGELAEGKVVLANFGKRCVVDPRSGSVSVEGGELGPVPSMLVLLYLSGAGEAQVTGKLISYRQLPGGDVFFAAFKKRVIDAVRELFPDRPEELLAAAERLGAERMPQGDAAVRIEVFPKLPITVILWRGDEEVAGSANVLFDESAPKILDTEDLAFAGSWVVDDLAEAKGSLQGRASSAR